jgi:hypothetical protein
MTEYRPPGASLQGFVRKPPLIVLFSILYFLLPAFNAGALYFSSELGFLDFFRSLWRGAFVYWNPSITGAMLLWLTGPLIAAGLFRVRLWAWYLFLMHALATLAYSYFRFATGELLLSPAGLVNILVLAPAAFFLRKEIRKPYFHPGLRWWEQHPRLKESLTVRLSWNEFVFLETTYDLSPDGIFVQTDNLDDVAVGYFFNICLEFKDDIEHPIYIQGIVVWINFTRGRNPCGYGVKFLGLANSQRQRIANFIKEGISSHPEKESTALRTAR